MRTLIIAVLCCLTGVANAGFLCQSLVTGQTSRAVFSQGHWSAYVKLPYGPKMCFADADELNAIKAHFHNVRYVDQINPAQDDNIWTGEDAEFINQNL